MMTNAESKSASQNGWLWAIGGAVFATVVVGVADYMLVSNQQAIYQREMVAQQRRIKELELSTTLLMREVAALRSATLPATATSPGTRP